MSLVSHRLLLLLLALALHGQAAAETVIEEYDDRVVVRIIGSPQQPGTPGQAAVENSEQQQELQRLREELHSLRMSQPGESPEQTRERKIKAAALQAKIRQLEQQQKESAALRE